jgi:putative ABC transport system substrate-binding protein
LFDVRFGDAGPVRIRAIAAELVSLKPDVIVTVGSLATRAVQQQTPTIPIVFVVASDPLDTGLVKSVRRPEGNTTGIGGEPSSLGSKRVQLLKEAAPWIKRIALLYDPQLVPLRSAVAGYFTSIEEAADALAIQLFKIPYSNATEIERGIDAFAAEPNGGLIIFQTGFEDQDRQALLGLATKYRLPAMYWNRAYVAAGGLMSYGANGVATEGEHY